MRFIKIFLFLFIINVALAAHTYSKVVLEEEGAICLDGTKSAYYVYQGRQKTKFLLSFEGGAWCGNSAGLSYTLESCLARSKTDLGSSAQYPDTMSVTYGIMGDREENYFKDWTIVYLKYCDGTGHQGYKKDPIVYKGQNLYFRGQNITIAQLNSLQQRYQLFSDATDIVITGFSAGGLAVFVWTNYIVERASKNTKLWAMPDSGIFLDVVNINTKQNSFRLWFQNFMKLSNQEIDPPTKQCVEAYKEEKWKCLFAEYLHKFIKIPLFSIQSLYDSWSLAYIIGLKCQKNGSFSECNETELGYIQSYHDKTSSVLKQIGKDKRNGYWAPACSNHVYSSSSRYESPDFRIPQRSGFSPAYCVNEWLSSKESSFEHMDSMNWPNNRPCSGLQTPQLIE